MNSLAQHENELKHLKNSGSGIIESLIDITIWFDVEEEHKATKLDMTTVERLELDENMFASLPTMKITLTDDGTYFNYRTMKIGRKIFVKLIPAARTDDEKEVEPIVSRMTVKRTIMKVDQNSGKTNLLIDCCLDAQGMINEIVDYPKETLISVPIPENSKQTLENVCGSIGIPLASDIEPVDYMSWVNGTLTGRKFIDKIVNHSWVEEDDATVFFVDLAGVGHYTSLKKMVQASDKYSAMSQQNFNVMCSTVEHKELYENYLQPEGTIIYQDLKQINLGADVNNVGGGVQKACTYDPIGLNDKILLATSSKTSSPDVENLSLSERPDTDYLLYEGNSDNVFLGTESVREAAQGNKNNRAKQVGLYSTNTHPWYDIAEANNYAVKLGFFQQFWKLTIDINKQPGYFYKIPSLFPRIGKLIEVDFTNGNDKNDVYTGKYLITRVQHVWTTGNSYAIAITVCADGYYSSQQKCKFHDKCKNKENCVFHKNFTVCKYYEENVLKSK